MCSVCSDDKNGDMEDRSAASEVSWQNATLVSEGRLVLHLGNLSLPLSPCLLQVSLPKHEDTFVNYTVRVLIAGLPHNSL